MLQSAASLNPVMVFFLGFPLLWYFKKNQEESTVEFPFFKGYKWFVLYSCVVLGITGIVCMAVKKLFLSPGALYWLSLKTDFRFLSAFIFWIILLGVMRGIQYLVSRYLPKVSLSPFLDTTCTTFFIGKARHQFSVYDHVKGAYLCIICLVIFRENSFLDVFFSSIGAGVGWTLGLLGIIGISILKKAADTHPLMEDIWVEFLCLSFIGIALCMVWGLRFI